MKNNQFSSVQFSFISAPPHEQNNKMLKSFCVVKNGVRKRKKQQNELTLCLLISDERCDLLFNIEARLLHLIIKLYKKIEREKEKINKV